MVSHAYWQGEAAYNDGLADDACPYPRFTLSNKEWFAGFHAARIAAFYAELKALPCIDDNDADVEAARDLAFSHI